jgi:hypothetical protein
VAQHIRAYHQQLQNDGNVIHKRGWIEGSALRHDRECCKGSHNKENGSHLRER